MSMYSNTSSRALVVRLRSDEGPGIVELEDMLSNAKDAKDSVINQPYNLVAVAF